jgi:hypothetical protein
MKIKNQRLKVFILLFLIDLITFSPLSQNPIIAKKIIRQNPSPLDKNLKLLITQNNQTQIPYPYQIILNGHLIKLHTLRPMLQTLASPQIPYPIASKLSKIPPPIKKKTQIIIQLPNKSIRINYQNQKRLNL